MAGKFETPRQKMIGMMYLVLTALLALQVSSALIYKFQALNASLEKTVTNNDADNQKKQVAIASLVKQRGQKAREVALSERAREVRLKTQQMLAEVDAIKKELIDKTGGYDSEGGFKGAKDETQVEVIMIGANKSGKAYELKQKLDNYVKFMNKHSIDRFDGLAKNASEDPTLKNNSDQKNKDYAHLNYGQMPMVAALAVLSETEAKILNMENSVVTAIADSLRLEDYTVDHMMPVVKPQSDFVVAGTKYNAEMFMAATSSAAKPQMTMGSSILSVDNNGVGSLSFIASGGNYKPDGTMKKTWTGSIKMKNQRGQDTTYMITHEYTVVKPVIQVQSGTVPQLYKNCGNKLNISVPALGAAYHPSFRVEGASVINGDRPGVVTLVPTSARVRVGVTNNGSFLGEELFGVKLIPKPTIDVKVNNQKVPPLEGLPANAPRIMTVRIIPDITFAQNLPEECRYFAEGTITLARRKTKMKEIPFNGIQIPLNAFAGLMQPGDRIIVEVSKVRRKNFKNEMEDVNMERYFETIILN